MTTQHRDEAIRALQQVRDRLAGPEPIEGLARYQLKANVEYALGEVEQIQELKRQRRAPEARATP